jgi:hypothetical protein
MRATGGKSHTGPGDRDPRLEMIKKVTRARALIYEALQPAATAPGLPEPVKPKDVEAFAAKAPFHETFVAVTVEPLAE